MIDTGKCSTSQRLKIAIVEDSPIIVSRVQSLLSDVESVEFVGDAPSVDSALELVERNLPDVVIIDISLKASDGRNGIVLLNTLKRLYPTVVVIMLTNLTDWYYRTQCATGGADYFFDKSNDFEKIPDAIAGIARRRIPLLHCEPNPQPDCAKSNDQKNFGM